MLRPGFELERPGMKAQLLLQGRCVHSTARHVLKRRVHQQRQTVTVPCASIREVQRTVRNKQQSAAEILEQFLARLDSTEPTYHSFLSRNATAARAQVDTAQYCWLCNEQHTN